MEQLMVGKRASLRDRVLRNVVVDLDGPRLVDDSPCWMWEGFKNEKGYGYAGRGRAGEGLVRVHRAVYELWFGPVSPALELDHLCHRADVSCHDGDSCIHRACCNPAHLQLVTHRENLEDRRRFARVCAECGQSFMAAGAKARFCSKVCNMRTLRRKKKGSD